MFQSVSRLLAAQGGQCYWVLGDLILDRYLQGTCQRLSPEAPVPIVQSQATELRMGGAANLAHNLAALGARVEVFGVLGRDEEGAQLEAMMKAAGIGTDGVVHSTQRLTVSKTRILARNQQLLRIDRESSRALDARVRKAVIRRLQEAPPPSAIVVADYVKGVVSGEVIDFALACAHRHDVQIFVDSKCEDLGLYRGCTALVPNEFELLQAARLPLTASQERIDAVATDFVEELALSALVLTMGSKGIVLYEPGREPRRIRAQAAKVLDGTGAGDTVMAFVAAGKVAGLDWPRVAELACVAAGFAVGELGTAVVPSKDLARIALRDHNRSFGKVVGLQELLERLTLHRLQGHRIVLTNGCFDIIHIGHLRLLEAARREGDMLVVAINSDASVKRIKGDGRPLVPQEERAEVLAALEAVSAVVIFDEDTPLQLIETIEPDVLVKGGDYAIGEVVGREPVEARGGQVVIFPLIPERSTTALLRGQR